MLGCEAIEGTEPTFVWKRWEKLLPEVSTISVEAETQLGDVYIALTEGCEKGVESKNPS